MKKVTTGKRKAIGKKKRFEVFKRDKFTCQYCGEKAPGIILHIDHIIPVCKGGTNKLTNLITSCVGCNLGKGGQKLSDGSIVEKQRSEMELQQEKINQIKMMAEWEMQMLSAEDAEFNAVNDIIIEIVGYGVNTYGKTILKKLIKKHGLSIVLPSAKRAFSEYYTGDKAWDKAFKMITVFARNSSLPEWQQEAWKYYNFSSERSFDSSKFFRGLISKYPERMEGVDFSSVHTYGITVRDYYEAIMREIDVWYAGGNDDDA